jgi:hypothetical protein
MRLGSSSPAAGSGAADAAAKAVDLGDLEALSSSTRRRAAAAAAAASRRLTKARRCSAIRQRTGTWRRSSRSRQTTLTCAAARR